MKRMMSVVAIAGIVMMAMPAFAAEDRGLSLGLRTGFGLPIGDFAKDAPMSDMLSGNVPIWFDLGYRVSPNLSLGGFVQYGIGFIEEECPNEASCSASVVRLGVQAIYSIQPKDSFSPWMGLGIGYESVSMLQSEGSNEFEGSFSGFEFVNLQLGADFKAAPQFTVGPFIMFSVARYSDAGVELFGSSISGEIEDQAIHGWLQFGLKGTFNL